ncbi:hypothetical protein B0H14DRAFT_2619266 [Mycena olivaceomarginata]|nr:hypothetical protein B0H14DRAFT_2619266 [Mycena olivaceomarginata]
MSELQPRGCGPDKPRPTVTAKIVVPYPIWKSSEKCYFYVFPRGEILLWAETSADRKFQPRDVYLSDEVSGPDEESGGILDAWKVRCAVAAEKATYPASLTKTKFLEVLIPAWCSPPYSKLIHDLEEFWFSQTEETNYRVWLGRLRIPNLEPYNLGIADGWLAENAPSRRIDTN